MGASHRSTERGSTKADTLRMVAKWYEDECRILAVNNPNDDAATVARAVLSKLAFDLRMWAETGAEPAHQPVKAEWPGDIQSSEYVAAPISDETRAKFDAAMADAPEPRAIFGTKVCSMGEGDDR